MPESTAAQRVHPLAPIVALDIDGTLGDYYNHFSWFAELYTQRKLEVDWSATTEFSEALGMSKEEYRQVKLAYRQGGMKRCMPAFPEVLDLVKSIRERGVQVWICTTRPWNRLDNIDPDTMFWINRNLGRVDGVIYGEEKYENLLDIAATYGQKVLGVVDDLPENIERASQLGLPSIMRVGPQHQSIRDWYINTPGLSGAGTAYIKHYTHLWIDRHEKSAA